MPDQTDPASIAAPLKGDMMRPKSIALFERLFVGGTAASILAIAIHYGAWRDYAVSRGGAAASPLIGIVFATVTGWLFWFFIARRGSNVAKWLLWISIAFTLIGLPEAFARAKIIGQSYTALFLTATILQMAASLLLLRKDAKQWFQYKGRIPESLSDVFG